MPLHVRAHQRTVRVIVLEKRHKRCGYRNELLRTHIDIVDLVARDQDEVPLPARIDEFGGDAQFIIQFNVRLRNRMAIFFPR